jgi:ABC-2 type transport system ATP-binding protein
VGGFSLGTRQRLASPQPCSATPKILIRDEPANGLDPEGVRWLRELLRGLASQGRTILVSSHRLAEVVRESGQLHSGRAAGGVGEVRCTGDR